MEVYCKEHIIMFHKCSHVCDPTLDIKFLHHVQVHHNMNSKPEILMEKLQMLVFAFVSNEPKVHWLKQWNQFAVLYVAQKDPMQGSQMPLLINGFTRPFFGIRLLELEHLFNISLTLIQSITIYLKCSLLKIVHSCSWSSKQ